MAVPTFAGLMQAMRLESATARAERTIRYARSMAIRNRQQTVICPAETDTLCRVNNNWSGNWLVYIEQNGDPGLQDGDQLLRLIPGGRHVKIEFNRGAKILTNSKGRLAMNGSLRFCINNRTSSQQIHSARLVMIHSGRLRLERENVACPG